MEVSPNSTTEPLNMYNFINNYLMNPIIFTSLVLIVIIIVLVSLSLGKNTNQSTSDTISSENNNIIQIYGIIGICLFVILVIINGFQYFFGKDIYASIKNIFYGIPEIDIKVIPKQNNQILSSLPIQEITSVNQVFNIPGNYYQYNDAKALCTAYGARLATYDEIENAYNNGAEWCNYGWSDSQMALFPTQKTTYDNLQKIKGHQLDCGRTGINGGYIANPAVKFGVNCYGHKPRINQEEQQLMDVTTPYPKTKQDLYMEQQVSHWKNKLNEILVSPFNYTTWSKI
jgi:hypothetical protein